MSHQNTFLELNGELLGRIELATEDIARNSTREFVDHEIQAMIDLFAKNLNITIDEVSLHVLYYKSFFLLKQLLVCVMIKLQFIR